jgi:hypothetical protein
MREVFTWAAGLLLASACGLGRLGGTGSRSSAIQSSGPTVEREDPGDDGGELEACEGGEDGGSPDDGLAADGGE